MREKVCPCVGSLIFRIGSANDLQLPFVGNFVSNRNPIFGHPFGMRISSKFDSGIFRSLLGSMEEKELRGGRFIWPVSVYCLTCHCYTRDLITIRTLVEKWKILFYCRQNLYEPKAEINFMANRCRSSPVFLVLSSKLWMITFKISPSSNMIWIR